MTTTTMTKGVTLEMEAISVDETTRDESQFGSSKELIVEKKDEFRTEMQERGRREEAPQRIVQSNDVPPRYEYPFRNSLRSIRLLKSHVNALIEGKDPQLGDGPHYAPNNAFDDGHDLQSLFRSRVQHDGQTYRYPSLRYTMQGFWENWQRMMEVGVLESAGSDRRLVLFVGDNSRYMASRADSSADSSAHNGPSSVSGGQEVLIEAYDYGLANMAAFLAQAMVDGIYGDDCDERNADAVLEKDEKGGLLPVSNACGQFQLSYQDWLCGLHGDHHEDGMECPVDPQQVVEASTPVAQSAAALRMKCAPRGTFAEETAAVESNLGRSDAEGCCFWGRGPLQTKGVCNIGKINYYLGQRAIDEGRAAPTSTAAFSSSSSAASSFSSPFSSSPSSIVFEGVDFCSNPQHICRSEDALWTTAMLEWSERIQRYQSGNWTYLDALVAFVNDDRNIDGIRDDKQIDYSFIDAVSSIVNRGCHTAPDCHFYGPVRLLDERRQAFRSAMRALRIPRERASQLRDTTLKYVESKRDGFESNLLQHRLFDGGYSPSIRYQFDDFIDTLSIFSLPITHHHPPFYMGHPFIPNGHKYGLANIAVLFAIGLDQSIEEERCDEHNEFAVSGKLPLSNACGQRGASYQDMTCTVEEEMSIDTIDHDKGSSISGGFANVRVALACDVDPAMHLSAVPHDRQGLRIPPPPFTCAPTGQVPFTGYWDFEEGIERKEHAYANENGRTDVEGCCWWGRGLLQSKGVCSYGKLNYYLGKRAADEGRTSLYPDIDFCASPEAVCGSQTTQELVWVAGFFAWIDRIQRYDRGGFRYLEKLHEFADGGFVDDAFIRAVASIVEVGCHDPPCLSEDSGCLSSSCDAASPSGGDAIVTKAYRTIVELNLWDEFPPTPGGTSAPSQAPTSCEGCTSPPTQSPVGSTPRPTRYPTNSPTTSFPSTSPSLEPDGSASFYFHHAKEHLADRRNAIENEILVSETSDGKLLPSKSYSFDGFLQSLSDTATHGAGSLQFYLGQGTPRASVGRRYGLVNLAVFLSHAKTRGLRWDSCEEINSHLLDGKLPMSNACGQHGRSYQDSSCPDLECPVDADMSLEQASVGNADAPPFWCGPSSTHPFTGYYDPLTETTFDDVPYSNQMGRVNVEGCCWWGRGVLWTSGTCAMGRFDHFLGRRGRYGIDFCATPDYICSDTPASTNTSPFSDVGNLRWIFGMFYWMDHVQTYSQDDFDYMKRLKQFVDEGMVGDFFIDDVSDRVLESPSDKSLRKAHFQRILGVLGLEDIEDAEDDLTWNPSFAPSDAPSDAPSEDPTQIPSLERTRAPVPLGRTPRPTLEVIPGVLPSAMRVDFNGAARVWYGPNLFVAWLFFLWFFRQLRPF